MTPSRPGRFGVTVDTEDALGLTAYMHARRLGYRDLAALLKDKGLASVGHGDFLFRSPREWSQIGKFERKKAIQIQTEWDNNAARILGKPQLVVSPRLAVPAVVLPSYKPPTRRQDASRRAAGIFS